MTVPSNNVSVKAFWSELAGRDVEVTPDLVDFTARYVAIVDGEAQQAPLPSDRSRHDRD